jgi:hypothetical protein
MFLRELPLRSPAAAPKPPGSRFRPGFGRLLSASPGRRRFAVLLRRHCVKAIGLDAAQSQIDRLFKRGESVFETVVAGMRLAQEPGFTRIRLADHAKLVELARQHIVEPIVGPLPRPIINWGRWRKEQAEHRGMAREGVNDPTLIEDLRHSRLQPLAAYGDGFERVGVIENAETGLGRRKRHRMRGVGAAMRHAPTKLAHTSSRPATTAIG